MTTLEPANPNTNRDRGANLKVTIRCTSWADAMWVLKLLQSSVAEHNGIHMTGADIDDTGSISIAEELDRR